MEGLNYEMLMQVLLLLLPIIIMTIVAFAKRRKWIDKKSAPGLVTILALGAAGFVYMLYPDQNFSTIVTTIQAGLGAAGIYSLGKFANRHLLLPILPGGT